MFKTLPLILIFLCLINACNISSKKEVIANSKTKQSVTENDLPAVTKSVQTFDTSNMVFFTGGKILLGSETGSQRNQPRYEVEIEAFFLDKFLVTVSQFSEFVESTSYVTDAEKYGDSGIFDFELGVWNLVEGTYWKMPSGPGKDPASPDHPVTHVSWNDARTYAAWAGKRLPNEFEWEYAARNGKSDAPAFPWGDQETLNNNFMANTWQGSSAVNPIIQDGYLTTSPIGSFAPSEAGLYDLSGNVWEWCSNTFRPYPGSSFRIPIDENVKAIRGGSFMYDELGAESFSVYGRSYNTVETSLFNTGFRCAADPE